jgi:hypothetical protein
MCKLDKTLKKTSNELSSRVIPSLELIYLLNDESSELTISDVSLD